MNSTNTTNNNDLLNLDSLDDWLESDLRQSGILLPSAVDNKSCLASPPTPTPIAALATPVMMASPPISECTPRLDPLLDLSTPVMKYEPLSPMETPKIAPEEITKSSIDLEPFIKALTLLGSIQQQQHSNNTATTSNSSISNNNNINNKRERSQSIEDEQQQDIVILKRQRNTDAARRSRQRKAQKMDSLEKRVLELEAENERLRLRAAIAESERITIETKEKKSRVRIVELEGQLADTHKALLRYGSALTTNQQSTTIIKI